MDGFLNVLKQPGMTSSDAVLTVRRMLPRGTAVGHGGTLDPQAAGVLPVCVGRATRLFDYIIDKQKTYIGELRLGIVTDTQDACGRVTGVSPAIPDADAVKAALSGFTGDILQTPPAYSAIKVDGRRMYDRARKGEDIPLPPRSVKVYAAEYVTQIAPDRHMLMFRCGKGVYIRTLMHDIGRTLGCGGHMSFLLRAEAGAFAVRDALTVEELRQNGIENALLPMDYPLCAYPRADVLAHFRKQAENGAPLPPEAFAKCLPNAGAVARVYVEGVFAGMGEVLPDGGLKFRAMLLPRA